MAGLLHWLLCCAVLAGCADLPAPPTELAREGWGRLVIVPAGYPPRSNFRDFAVGEGAGAAGGAAAGATAGLLGSGAFAAAGALEAVVAPYLAVVLVPVMAAGGAYAGSRAAVSQEDAAAIEAVIQRNLADLQLPLGLAKAIGETVEVDTGLRLPLLADAGPAVPEAATDYRALAGQDADSVLEVVATEVGFSGGRELRFHLVAVIRIVDSRDGHSRYQREFVYQSDPYPAPLWGARQAALLQAELYRALDGIAGSVVEQVFLLTDLPLESRATTGGEGGPEGFLRLDRDACGLAWVSPERDFHLDLRDMDQRHMNRFPPVAGTQPRLVWQSFPRDVDREAGNRDILPSIDRVRYDLRVWEVAGDLPPRLIYERRDLPEAAHTLEQSLAPKGRYFWSARARFELGGAVHGTKWGCFRSPWYATYGGDRVKPERSPVSVLGPLLAGTAPRDPCTLDFIPVSNYYRFRIP